LVVVKIANPQVREGKTEDAARSIDTPHGVKSALDVVDQRNEGESQHQEADSNHNVVLCARNVGVGEVHQLGDDVIGQAHVITELGFEIAVETKTAPHREEQRQEGNDGEHGGVSQRGDVREEVVAVDLLPKAANHLRRTAAPVSVCSLMAVSSSDVVSAQASCASKASGGGQVHIRWRSPHALSTRETGGKYLSVSMPASGKAAVARE